MGRDLERANSKWLQPASGGRDGPEAVPDDASGACRPVLSPPPPRRCGDPPRDRRPVPVGGALCSSAPCHSFALRGTPSPGKSGYGLLAIQASPFQVKPGVRNKSVKQARGSRFQHNLPVPPGPLQPCGNLFGPRGKAVSAPV